MNVVRKCLITEIFLHSGDMYCTPFCQFLKFGKVDRCTVKCYYLVVAIITRAGMNESLEATEENCTSQETPSLACITGSTLILPFFFPVLGCLSTPLKIALENSEMVEESMILSSFIHFLVPLRRLSEEITTFGY